MQIYPKTLPRVTKLWVKGFTCTSFRLISTPWSRTHPLEFSRNQSQSSLLGWPKRTSPRSRQLRLGLTVEGKGSPRDQISRMRSFTMRLSNNLISTSSSTSMKAQSSLLRLDWIKLRRAGIRTEIIPSVSSWSLTSMNRISNSSSLKTILRLMTIGSRLALTLKISKRRGSLMQNSRWAPLNFPRLLMIYLRIHRHLSYRKQEIDLVSW